MAQPLEEYDTNVKPLFVYKRQQYQDRASTQTMSSEELCEKEKQILVPSFIFSQFEINDDGQEFIPDQLGNKVALCFAHFQERLEHIIINSKCFLPGLMSLKNILKKCLYKKKLMVTINELESNANGKL